MSPPDRSTASPFAARTRAPLVGPEGSPAGGPPTNRPKRARSVWLGILGALALVGLAGGFWLGRKAVAPTAPVVTPPLAAPAPSELAPQLPTRDAKTDYEALATRARELDLEPMERAVLAEAGLRAATGAFAEAQASLGPVVARRLSAMYAARAEGLQEIRLEDHPTPEAQQLRLDLARAEYASRKELWIEAMRHYESALVRLMPAMQEIATRLSDLASVAAERGDTELATYFYERVLQITPESTAARAYWYAHKFDPGERLQTDLGLEFAYVPPGDFERGSPASELGRDNDEIVARVRLTRGVFFGVTEITQRQWDAVFGSGAAERVIKAAPARSLAIGPDLPMHSVRWDEARTFTEQLSTRTTQRYRLPTEAEWEYACRAGTLTAFGNGLDVLSAREANIDDGSAAARLTPAPAGTLGRPNLWGLRDLHGNVWEWCADWSAPYPPGEWTDPRGPEDDAAGRPELAMRVVRGGGWNAPAKDARSANRWEGSPVVATGYIGFRVVLEPDVKRF